MSREGMCPEVRAELERHIEMRAQDNMRAGMDSRAAWADARRRFGDLEAIGARCTRLRRRTSTGDTLRAIGLTGLLAVVVAVTSALPAAPLPGSSEVTSLIVLAALAVTTLAFSVTVCCLCFSMTRRRER
jgi:hypothetical protein